MDDERACSSLSCRLLELVSPSAIVGHRLSAKFGLVFELRVVDQYDNNFALHIVFEIVPLIFGRDDTITAENQFSFCADDRLLSLRPCNEVVRVLQCSLAACARKLER